jgi:hypothetical protein
VFHPRFSYDKHQDCLLSGDELSLPDHLRIALFWSRTHRLTEQMAEERLAGRYIASRLEDLCADPETEIRGLFNWLVAGDERAQAARAFVKSPLSIGRWRTESDSLVERITTIGAKALDAFGYR